MSLNKPFFGNKSGGKSPYRIQKEKDIRDMHWTTYLDKYPLSKERRWEDNVKVDFDIWIDNWDTDDEPEINE